MSFSDKYEHFPVETTEIVQQIRREYLVGTPNVASSTSLVGLAKKFGIAFQTVSKIVNRKSWRHV